MHCQFYPGSPEKPTVEFHFKLMDRAEKSFLHCQVAFKEFAEVVQGLTTQLQPCLASMVHNVASMTLVYVQMSQKIYIYVKIIFLS